MWEKVDYDKVVNPSDEGLVLQYAKHYFPRHDAKEESSEEENDFEKKSSSKEGENKTFARTIPDFNSLANLAKDVRNCANHEHRRKRIKEQAKMQIKELESQKLQRLHAAKAASQSSSDEDIDQVAHNIASGSDMLQFLDPTYFGDFAPDFAFSLESPQATSGSGPSVAAKTVTPFPV